MKRVLIFSLQYFPLVGGAEIAIKEITDRISDEETEFHMITLRYHAESLAEEKIGNVHVHRIGKGEKGLTFSESFSSKFYIHKVLFVPMAAMKGIELHKKIHFTSAWAMMTYMIFPIVLMRFCGVRIPYLLTIQEGDPFERVFQRRKIRLFSPLLFYGVRNATVVQPISHFLGEWARRCGYKGPIHVVPNGVSVEQFTHNYSDSEISAMKETLGKKEKEVFLVTTSRLVHKNATDDVIRALPHLPENVSFLIYGIGPDEEMLRALAKELGVESRARFMGQISHKEMPLMLKACDIFIRPSRSEGMGNSFIEAMAAGLPVVATQVGGITDFLFDEKRNPETVSTGFAVDVNSSNQIAEIIKDIIDDPEKVEAVVKEAKLMVIEKYNWDIIAKDMKNLM